LPKTPAKTAARAASRSEIRVRAGVLADYGEVARTVGISDWRALIRGAGLDRFRLDDPEAMVRRQACLAVAACVPREHFSIVKIIDKLDHRMVHDQNDGVRLEAVEAMAALGAPADVPRLEKALTHELNKEIRGQIESAIATLKKRG